jgi:hypothetical protein
MDETLHTLPEIPAFRLGQAYESLSPVELRDARTGDVRARVHQVNAGVIRRDLRRVPDAFTELQTRSTAEMLDVCARAADLFVSANLPAGLGGAQSPADYVRLLSATCGLPHALIRRNMDKLAGALREMPMILKGLTRGLPLSVIDTGLGVHDGVPVSFVPATTHLGLVLPSNSPGVNSLWLPALALRIPVLLKPGREDPWTPWRLVNALVAAGCPASAFGFYPTDHEGAGVILDACSRVILFGDSATVAKHAGNPRISVHGPGFSKVLIGEDAMADWPALIDLLAESVAANGGRSCVNASTIVVPSHGREVAEALARRLAELRPLPPDDPSAGLAAFMNAAFADAINRKVDEGLATGGAEDLSAELRGGSPRSVDQDGLRYLLPTVVYCTRGDHPLARTEFLFPFAAVVEMPQAEMTDWIGPSLVVSGVTTDPHFRRCLLACRSVPRLNLGHVPTTAVRWDQPHEGNLFEWLYTRRAIQDVP